MKYNIKQSSLLMLFALFLVAFCFIACDDQDNEEQEQVGQLTPEALESALKTKKSKTAKI